MYTKLNLVAHIVLLNNLKDEYLIEEPNMWCDPGWWYIMSGRVQFKITFKYLSQGRSYTRMTILWLTCHRKWRISIELVMMKHWRRSGGFTFPFPWRMAATHFYLKNGGFTFHFTWRMAALPFLLLEEWRLHLFLTSVLLLKWQPYLRNAARMAVPS